MRVFLCVCVCVLCFCVRVGVLGCMWVGVCSQCECAGVCMFV